MEKHWSALVQTNYSTEVQQLPLKLRCQYNLYEYCVCKGEQQKMLGTGYWTMVSLSSFYWMPRWKRTILPLKITKAKQAAALAKKAKVSNNQQELINMWLLMPLEEEVDGDWKGARERAYDNNSTSTESRCTSLESELEKNECITRNSTNTNNTNKNTNPVIIKNHSKIKDTAEKLSPTWQIEIYNIGTVAYPEGEETFVMMTSCAHSMFMNCIPLTHKLLGVDVLEKIQSVVSNFKLHSFTPYNQVIPTAVGLCFYNCEYHSLPGIPGYFETDQGLGCHLKQNNLSELASTKAGCAMMAWYCQR